MQDISLVIVNYGAPELVRRLLETLAAHEDARLVHEAIVVDNGWPDRGDSSQALAGVPTPFPVRFVPNRSASYASGVNAGAAVASGEIILICNNDLEWLGGESLAPILEEFRHEPRLGVAGPRELYPDGRAQHSGGFLPGLWEAAVYLFGLDWLVSPQRVARRRGRTVPIPFVDGACLATTRSCFQALGGFDESYDFYVEDVDYCWRAARAGWLVRYVPAAAIRHIRGVSSMAKDPTKSLCRLARAKVAFVAQRESKGAAADYARIIRVGAVWRVIAFAPLALLSPRFAQRRDLARLWAQAHRRENLT